MSKDTKNAVYIACSQNNVGMLRLLMKNGGNPNIIPNDGYEMTTYEFACYITQ